MDKYAETKQVISDMAAVKMAMNSHKGNIEDVHSNDLLHMIESEVKEMDDAISKGDLINTIEEAADIMNFLVAIVHQQITQYRNRK